jgi:hypothetical protein
VAVARSGRILQHVQDTRLAAAVFKMVNDSALMESLYSNENFQEGVHQVRSLVEEDGNSSVLVHWVSENTSSRVEEIKDDNREESKENSPRVEEIKEDDKSSSLEEEITKRHEMNDSDIRKKINSEETSTGPGYPPHNEDMMFKGVVLFAAIVVVGVALACSNNEEKARKLIGGFFQRLGNALVGKQ